MKSLFLVWYDISDEKRLSRVAKIMEDFGIRVLYSVFECRLNDEEFVEMKCALEREINPLEDRVRYYRLCPKCEKPVVHLGYGFRTRAVTGEDVIL